MEYSRLVKLTKVRPPTSFQSLPIDLSKTSGPSPCARA